MDTIEIQMIIKDIMSNYMCQQIGQYGISRNIQPSKTTPGKKQHLNRPTSSNETESVIKKKFPTNKDFTGEFYQTSKEKSAPVPLKLFPKTEAEGMLPHSSYETIIMQIIKPDEDTLRKELQANIPDGQRCRNSHHYTSKPNSIIHYQDYML